MMGAAGGAALDAQVQLLRSRVEDDLPKPAILLVTSARDGDGKTLTSSILAGAFRTQGHRTVVVRLHEAPDQGNGSFDIDGGTEDAPMSFDFTSCSGADGTSHQLAQLMQTLRSTYDYAIVDAGTFLKSAPTMALSRLVDGVLLTFRIGRAPSKEDQLTFAMLEHSRVRMIGVVATTPRTPAKGRPKKAVAAAVLPRAQSVTPAKAKRGFHFWSFFRFFRPNH